MKILWIINGPTSKVAETLGIKVKDSASWLTGFLSSLENVHEIELTVAFPLLDAKEVICVNIGKVKYKSFYQQQLHKKIKVPTNKITKRTRQHIAQIIHDVRPDILHLYGSEFEHALVAAQIFNNASNTLVHIQGLVSVIAEHYDSGLTPRVTRKFSISNLVRGSIAKQKERFKRRGKNEIALLNCVEHVSGRTDWDFACTRRINPRLNYHFCNENLREEFYNYQWDVSRCEKRTIFMSQASYPVKGMHFMIRALPDIIKHFPDVHLYIAGNDLTATAGIFNKLKISSYGLYIRSLIKELRLQDHITFTGFLNEREMCQRYLHAHVFVSASTIENSPNSVGEAMLVGTPTVTSDVGGVKNILTHGFSGFSYQYDAPYMLAYYVCKIFEDDQLAMTISRRAREQAATIHNREKNAQTLLNMYSRIMDTALEGRVRGDC